MAETGEKYTQALRAVEASFGTPPPNLDKRWEKVWASAGPLLNQEDLTFHPDIIEFLIELDYNGTRYWSKILVDRIELQSSYADLYKLTLDKMVESIDNHIREKENNK